MKKSLNFKESIIVGSMFFGMFFGAGNLIFPVLMGQLAGKNSIPAIVGFVLTGVSLPLLGVVCIGVSKKNSLFELADLVGDKYKYFFTMILYLTIGPFFAIPRCATTSFTVGIKPLLLNSTNEKLFLFLFSLAFFTLVLIFALKPSGIMNYIGKYINPLFLIFLTILIVVAFVNPIPNQQGVIKASGDYATIPFFRGFIEGYNTMDAIASLAFGITIITVIKNLGITDETSITLSIFKTGIIGCSLMAIIYFLTTIMGTMSRGMYDIQSNGGDVLAIISTHYFGRIGIYILLITVTLACLKTSIALVVSCSEIFSKMFPNILSMKKWTVIFTVFSFIVSNFGLNAIITYAVPVLMFIYPLAISIIFLSLFGKFFNYDRRVYATTTYITLLAAVFDFIIAFPKDSILPNIFIENVKGFAFNYIPFFELGLGWTVPMIVGVIIGIILKKINCR